MQGVFDKQAVDFLVFLGAILYIGRVDIHLGDATMCRIRIMGDEAFTPERNARLAKSEWRGKA